MKEKYKVDRLDDVWRLLSTFVENGYEVRVIPVLPWLFENKTNGYEVEITRVIRRRETDEQTDFV